MESTKSLFTKYLEDRCSKAEIRALLEYFNIPENESMLKDYILTELERQENFEELNESDEHFNQLYASIKTRIQAKDRQQAVFHIGWSRFAAAAMIVLTAGAGAFYYYNKKDQPIAADKILPGRDQAILTLADGSKIALHDASTGAIAEQSGFRVTKTSDGELVYMSIEDHAASDDEIYYNTIEAPVGGKWQVVLPDQTHVWLNALSSLTYPTNFKGDERKVSLKGEAYFEVTSNPSMPFKVESNGQVIEVIGTHFNVMAYADEPVVKTTLLEGAVKVSAAGSAKLLKPGEQAQVKGDAIDIIHDADLEEAVAWKDGYFKFNESLESMMSKIARWYNVKIEYEYHPDPSYTFAGKISRARALEEVLKVMEYSGKVRFTIEERRIIVRR